MLGRFVLVMITSGNGMIGVFSDRADSRVSVALCEPKRAAVPAARCCANHSRVGTQGCTDQYFKFQFAFPFCILLQPA
jgi:hypothetical protein